ncbi:hypothetical protein [Methanosarcina sp. Kolksee]|uniref:hypothetical protein n=1 Tax=Methanosarcina sp. Kolksee TaxID=1434099 RepID=UPI0012E09886|nr:hypothetical protein [Methanosarcina sp. Kolksee]
MSQYLGLMNLSPNPIGVITTLFKKGLTENHGPKFGFDELIPKPYRRDHNPFQKRLDRKP